MVKGWTDKKQFQAKPLLVNANVVNFMKVCKIIAITRFQLTSHNPFDKTIDCHADSMYLWDCNSMNCNVSTFHGRQSQPLS